MLQGDFCPLLANFWKCVNDSLSDLTGLSYDVVELLNDNSSFTLNQGGLLLAGCKKDNFTNVVHSESLFAAILDHRLQQNSKFGMYNS